MESFNGTFRAKMSEHPLVLVIDGGPTGRGKLGGLNTTKEEQRKHAILFAATLLCGWKRIETIEFDKPNLAM